MEKDYDIVIINAPLPDEFGTELALDVCEKTSSGVMMFVKSDVYSVVDDKVSGYGVLTISRPTTIQTITQSLALLCSTRERLRKMEQKTASIEDKMEEIRIVNHAKWLLIEQLRFSEKEAHKFIEKRAMDRCMSKRAVAEEKAKEGPLVGAGCVLTGSLSRPRSEYAKLIELAGGIVQSSVTGKTRYLVAGANVGATKTEKAKALGTEVIDEEKLKELLGLTASPEPKEIVSPSETPVQGMLF